MRVYAVHHLFREGLGERIRLTEYRSKKRAFKERGPMDRAWLVTQLLRKDFGVALQLGTGLMVVDKDGPNQGPFADLHSPMTANASRGEHLYFRTDIDGTNKIKFNGWEVDLLWNGIIGIPPSIMETGMERSWKTGIVQFADLPMFPTALLAEEKREERRPSPVLHVELPDDKKLEAMRRWIGFKFAESGAGGDAVTYKVALKIVSVTQNFEQAMAEILAWDRTNAIPPWSDTHDGVKTLEHKVRCAIKYLLK